MELVAFIGFGGPDGIKSIGRIYEISRIYRNYGISDIYPISHPEGIYRIYQKLAVFSRIMVLRPLQELAVLV